MAKDWTDSWKKEQPVAAVPFYATSLKDTTYLEKLNWWTEPEDAAGLKPGMLSKAAIRRAAIARWGTGRANSIDKWLRALDIPYSDEELALARLEQQADGEKVRAYRAEHSSAAYDYDVRCWVRDLLMSGNFHYVDDAVGLQNALQMPQDAPGAHGREEAGHE